ncbi:pentatricopeptide repeat-containing protein At3g56550 [Carica papaya]|uniref:pentatricopeptide repeat-containing protein At3g56550 n=1 Tax=Carica papaya TaxID=3649 RepID=UPI000B8C7E9B|nr:pentatricopeptide repeat-containing protein At3g56550 [Carica papaya]XP_021899068.1 pentatricopeptide repeat-containing protein At3g56550 [Carica papaya]XP_021899075.1 pentatricopeptide repeat-containing protein At3g56550 [Carica papaya]
MTDMSSKVNAILTLLQGCNSLKRLQKIQAHVIVNDLEHHPAISSQLLNFCAVSVSGCLAYAWLLFSRLHNPQIEAWNSIIRGFSLSPFPHQALLFYNRMLFTSSSNPDTFTFSFALKACERLRTLAKCQELHAAIIRSGFLGDVVVCTSLIKCYTGNGLTNNAEIVFNDMSQRDLVTWNAMISCYSKAGLPHHALNLYATMQREGMGLDAFTLVGLLSSCAHVGALGMGIELHRIACERGFDTNVYIGNALIDMYAKCGSLSDAFQIFDGMRKRDVFTWNSIIFGYGVHGHGTEAISLFEQMLMAGMQPNSITFLGLLCGCSHQGLVEEGVKHFHMMGSRFNVKPGIKHYGCIVDLYGRAGKLSKALEAIHMCPTQDDPVLWRTLLGSCKIHRNVEVGEVAMAKLAQLGAFNAGDCILLASIYLRANDAQGVARMRKLIKSQRIKTTPGWSWIEIGDQVHRFVVDDKSHPDSAQVYQKLSEVIHRATLAGYVPDESHVFEECLGSLGICHSEKLAIAFGLARTPEGASLRIVKNLRVCRDCHSFTKFVAKAFNREIIVRDRVRFHHFKGGVCSCRDYW